MQRKQVGAVAVEGFGPELPAGGGVGQLSVDADLFDAALHIALQDIAHRQILAHLLDIGLLVLKSVRSRRGNHKQPRRARQGQAINRSCETPIFLRQVDAFAGHVRFMVEGNLFQRFLSKMHERSIHGDAIDPGGKRGIPAKRT